MPFSYPQLDGSDASRDFQETFAGYNHNLRISDNEFYDMKNMTGDYYPVLSPRRKRGTSETFNNFQSIICKDALWYIDGNRLYNDGVEVTSFFSAHPLPQEGELPMYKMIGMGAYLLVFTITDHGLDYGWYVNTLDPDNDNGFIDNTRTVTPTQSQPLTLTMCTKDGEGYSITTNGNHAIQDNQVYVGDTAPSKYKNGTKWLDTSGGAHYLKIYAETAAMWTTVSTTYVKVSCTGIAQGFKEGDAVTISGLTSDDSDISEQVDFLNSNTIIQSIDENNGWFVIIGIIDKVHEQDDEDGITKPVTIERKAPYLDYICECNNRLWGCRYGFNRAGDVVNEIYACKQADFKNWFCYAGISTDSYAASVGSDGVWTGAVHYGTEVLFFKENCIHKLYGSMPSDYQLLELKIRGIQRGSEKSVVCVNETLFYKTPTEVVYYDGSLPVGISYQLGERNFSHAVAGSIGNKYYICMKNESGGYELFVYDIAKQLWHREGEIKVDEFCKVDNSLFAVINNELIDLMGTGEQEADFDWYVETGKIGYSYSDNKYVGRILVRLTKPLTSEISLLISYDDIGEWENVAEINGSGTRSFSIPIIPRRCDHFRVRIEGRGDCKIYSISKVLDIGSDG